MKNEKRDKIKKIIAAGIVLVMIFVIAIATVSQFSSERVAGVKEAQGFAAKRTVLEDIYQTELYGFDRFIDLYSVFGKITGIHLFEDAAYGHIIMDDSGKLHFPMESTYDKKYAEITAEFSRKVKEQGSKFLYVQAPNKMINGYTKFPKGAYNYSNEDADAFLADIENAGVDTLDLRDAVLSCGLNPDELFYDTDHHWRTKTAFWAYGVVTDELSKRYGIVYDIDGYYRDLANYKVTHYEDSFLGAQGRRVGEHIAGVDDYIFIEPAFDTDYEIYNMAYSVDEPVLKGTFSDAIKVKKVLESDSVEENRYGSYFGYDYGCMRIKNNLIDNDIKILLIKDSFALPFAAFLSTAVSEIHMIDLRNRHAPSPSEYIEEYDFDAVIVIYNTEVFNDKMFSFEKKREVTK